MKYIINVPDKAIELMNGHISVFIEPEFKMGDRKYYALRLSKEDIGPYTELDRKAIENAQEEVWMFVRYMALKMGFDQKADCFGTGSPIVVVRDLSFQEAKDKYDDWKAKREQICVGDEVKSKNKEWKGVVTNVDQNGDLIIMDDSGETGRYYKAKHFEKTGRYFTEIEELLKKMKEES